MRPSTAVLGCFASALVASLLCDSLCALQAPEPVPTLASYKQPRQVSPELAGMTVWGLAQ